MLVDLPQSKHKKTIIFDLDETLVHCVETSENEQVDIEISIKFRDEEDSIVAGINIRPGVRECLQEANKYF